MTLKCPGNGASVPRPGAQRFQNFAAGAISDVLFTEGMGWAAALAAGVGILSFDLDELCSKDPPLMPTIDAARIAGYFNPLNPTGALSLRDDFSALMQNYLWDPYCQCADGTHPTPPAPLPQPSGYVTDNPQVTSAPASPACGANQVFETKAWDASGNITWDVIPATPIPSASQWVSFPTNGGVQSGSSPYPVTHTLSFVPGAPGAPRQTFVWTQTADILFANAEQHQVPVPPGTASIAVSSHEAGTSSSGFTLEALFDYHCDVAPPQLAQPCCPPDPTLENLVAQVLRLEQLILDSLGDSHAYTRGTAHQSLSGSGTFQVSGLRGIAIDVSQGTPTTPLLEGVPPYQWNLGWVSIGDGGGFLQEQRITRQHQVWLPQAADLGLTVGYFLFPGVVATLTELDPA